MKTAPPSREPDACLFPFGLFLRPSASLNALFALFFTQRISFGDPFSDALPISTIPCAKTLPGDRCAFIRCSRHRASRTCFLFRLMRSDRLFPDEKHSRKLACRRRVLRWTRSSANEATRSPGREQNRALDGGVGVGRSRSQCTAMFTIETPLRRAFDCGGGRRSIKRRPILSSRRKTCFRNTLGLSEERVSPIDGRQCARPASIRQGGR